MDAAAAATMSAAAVRVGPSVGESWTGRCTSWTRSSSRPTQCDRRPRQHWNAARTELQDFAAMLAESEELRRKGCQSNMRRQRRRGRGRAGRGRGPRGARRAGRCAGRGGRRAVVSGHRAEATRICPAYRLHHVNCFTLRAYHCVAPWLFKVSFGSDSTKRMTFEVESVPPFAWSVPAGMGQERESGLDNDDEDCASNILPQNCK